MKSRKGSPGPQSAMVRGVMRSQDDIGSNLRKLHKDYRIAIAMTLAGRTDTDIVAELKVKGLTEEGLKTNMDGLLKRLGLDSFDDPVFQSRPVRRALKDVWAYQFGAE